MKKIILYILINISILFIFTGLTKAVNTVTPTDELVVDYECYQAKINEGAQPTSQFAKNCMINCDKWCLYKVDPTTSKLLRQNTYCNSSMVIDNKCNFLPANQDLQGKLTSVNFLGIETDRFFLIAARRILLAGLGVIGIIIISIGIYAMYKFSFADGNEEKIQEAIKIFKSLIVGTLMSTVGLAGVQIAAVMTGVTGSLADFDFIPRSGRIVVIYADDIGKKCFPEQTPVVTGGLGAVTCDPETNTWK